MSMQAAIQPNRVQVLRDCQALVSWLRATLIPPLPLVSPEVSLARSSAVLVPIFAGTDGDPHLLFTVRSTALARHSGEISFPGGKRDPGDVSLLATALREANEEIGLDAARVTPLGELAPVFTVVSNYVISPQVALVSGQIEAIAPSPNPAEVAEIIDAPLVALADPAICRAEEWVRLGRRHTVYFFHFGPYRIWGATAFILTDLLARLPTA